MGMEEGADHADKHSASTLNASKLHIFKPIPEHQQRNSEGKLGLHTPGRLKFPLICKTRHSARASSMSQVSPYLASARTLKTSINTRMAKFRVEQPLRKGNDDLPIERKITPRLSQSQIKDSLIP